MYEISARHERSFEEEMAELVSTDLHIAAGVRRIADLELLASRPNSADGSAAARMLIKTIVESVNRLRAFRAVVVDEILNYDKRHGRRAGSAAEDIDPIFRDACVESELVKAIDAKIRRLVGQHASPIGRDGAEGRFNCYREIEMLRRALDLLRAQRGGVGVGQSPSN